ncbi:MAG: uroporphyrinogen-III synthase [Thermoplasmatota archaeon]
MGPVVFFSRPEDRLEEAEAAVRGMGLEPLGTSLLRITPHPSPAFDRFLQGLRKNEIDLVLFVSATALSASRDLAEGRIADFLDAVRARHVGAIGPATAQALRAVGLPVRVVAPDASSAGLARELAPKVAGQCVALLRSTDSDPALPAALEKAGATVIDVGVYATTCAEAPRRLEEVMVAIRDDAIRAYAFTSAMTVRCFRSAVAQRGLEDAARRSLERAVVGAIGVPTKDALEAAGIRVDMVPPETSFEALVRGLQGRLETNGGPARDRA